MRWSIVDFQTIRARRQWYDQSFQTLVHLKNFRVMVTVTLTREPNSCMMKNTNSCPIPAQEQKATMFTTTLPDKEGAAEARSVSGRKESALARSGRRSNMVAISTLRWKVDSGLYSDDPTYVPRKRRELKTRHEHSPFRLLARLKDGHPPAQEHFPAQRLIALDTTTKKTPKKQQHLTRTLVRRRTSSPSPMGEPPYHALARILS